LEVKQYRPNQKENMFSTSRNRVSRGIQSFGARPTVSAYRASDFSLLDLGISVKIIELSVSAEKALLTIAQSTQAESCLSLASGRTDLSAALSGKESFDLL
jgi:hypothetical protein